jgi:D-sedoheptulose 7-phosphate isomerase
MTHSERYFALAAQISRELDHAAVERLALALAALRDSGGRLFCCGAGGSAANAAHCVNDFRKLCDLQAYSPTDNVAELTARVNDEGWETVFEQYLRVSRAGAGDALFLLSVGGGDRQRGISVGLIRAVDYARQHGLKVYGVVGRAGSHLATAGDEMIVVPAPEPTLVTPLAEAFQAVVWHALVSHPALAAHATTW